MSKEITFSDLQLKIAEINNKLDMQNKKTRFKITLADEEVVIIRYYFTQIMRNTKQFLPGKKLSYANAWIILSVIKKTLILE